MRYIELFWNCLYALTLGSLFGASAVACGMNVHKAFRRAEKEEES